MPKAKTGESRLLRVRVTPRSRRNEMGPLEDAAGAVVKVKLTAPPVDGRANEALIALVAETLGLPRSAIEIVAGEHSRLKTLRLHGVPADAPGAPQRSPKGAGSPRRSPKGEGGA